VGLTDAELIRRYQAKEPVEQLAAEAGLTRSGVYGRLRRLGIPPRTAPPCHNDDTIRRALADHRSINAAAKALGISRIRLTAEAQRLGLRDPPTNIPDDLAERYREERSLARLAARYQTSAPTVSGWLAALGIPREPPGRRQRP
jgi:hypothetical protein